MIRDRIRRLFRTIPWETLYKALAPALVFFLVWKAAPLAQFQRLENLTTDWRFQMRAAFGQDPPSDSHVVLVAIDQPSLDVLGAWPWSRAVHGDFLQLVSLLKPSVVAFDIFFSEPGPEAADQHLAKSVAMLPNFVTGAARRLSLTAAEEKKEDIPLAKPWGPTQPLRRIHGDINRILGAKAGLPPIEPLRKNSYFGFIDCVPSSADGIRRTVPMMVRIAADVFPSLSFQALCRYWDVEPDQVEVWLGREIVIETKQGIRHIPIDERGGYLVNWHNKKIFTTIGYGDLYENLGRYYEKNEPWPSKYPPIEGQILVVGQTELGLVDLGPSPIEGISPLVLVNVNAINNILRGDHLRVVPLRWVLLAWTLVGYLSLYALRDTRVGVATGVPLIVAALYVAVAFLLFFDRNLLLPVFWPVAAYLLLNLGQNALLWVRERQSRQHIKSVFSSYIAPRVMEQVLKHQDGVPLGGVRKAVTILFSDIRGFTSISETTREEELVIQLNEYFTHMVDCVNRSEGTLHKYIGDAVMAVWGDVISENTAADARNAVRAALDMREKVAKLNARWESEKRPPFRIGIGLNHGEVVVGNIGAPQRMEFTVIGDAVNLAARLESLTKHFKIVVAVSESVRDLCRQDFLFRSVGLIQVEGKIQTVRVYEAVQEWLPTDSAAFPKWLKIYEQGFEAYLGRRFGEAIELFGAALQEKPDDYCSRFYRDESLKGSNQPLPTDSSVIRVKK